VHVLMANGTLQGGGAERMIAILSRQLRAMGHRVSIAALSAGGEVLDELRAEGFETADGVSRNRAAGIWSTAARLKRFVRDRGVDVVHTHDLRSLIEVGVCRRLTGAFRHVHTFHFGNYPHLPRKHLALEHVFSRTPDRLVAVGHAQCESVTRALRLPRRRVRVIWNGVDRPGEDKADRSEERAARRTAPVVASVSAFFPQKGLPVLLEAARIVRARGVGFRLVLVGNGPLRVGSWKRS
jgi:glycosyltransferase involved in cell wall biosynthesis